MALFSMLFNLVQKEVTRCIKCNSKKIGNLLDNKEDSETLWSFFKYQQ